MKLIKDQVSLKIYDKKEYYKVFLLKGKNTTFLFSNSPREKFINHSMTGSPQVGHEKAPGGILVPHRLQVQTSLDFEAIHTFLVGFGFVGLALTLVAVPVA